MSDLLELSAQYRETGRACRSSMHRLRDRLAEGGCGCMEEFELKRQITMLTAMSRDCIAIANYLTDYYERRARHGQDVKTSGK